MNPEMMQAIVVHQTGGPQVLKYEQVLRPVPLSDEVLIKIHSAGVNPAETHVRSGYSVLPESIRPVVNVPYIPGSDLAGQIIEVGAGVTDFKVNDEVFGLINFPPPLGKASGKTYAQYAIAKPAHLALKPNNLTFIEAGAVPMAALTAWQQLCLDVPIKPGQTVMVRGAAGGVGHFAVQFAKIMGAKVIAVASEKNEEFLKEIGADEFLDYEKKDLLKTLARVNVLFNCIGGSDSGQLYKSLKRGSTVITLVPPPMIQLTQREELLANYDVKLVGTLVHSNGDHLTKIAKLLEEGKLTVKIDQEFALQDAEKAHEYAENGHLQGKIVLQTAVDFGSSKINERKHLNSADDLERRVNGTN